MKSVDYNIKIFRPDVFGGIEADGPLELPIVKKYNGEVPKELLAFNKAVA